MLASSAASKPATGLTGWWQNWKRRRALTTELMAAPDDLVASVARDIGVSIADLRELAGKDVETAELLIERLKALRLDPEDLSDRDPLVMRDLQRLCSLCESKGRCAHDLASNPDDPRWTKYCPNVATLKTLVADRAASKKRIAS